MHISQICDRFIKHPLEAVKLGDVVQVVAAQKHIAAISTGAISSRIWGTAPIACKASVPFQVTIAAMATISKAPMPQLNR